MTIALVEKLSDVRDFRKILETTVKEIGETYSADLSQIVLSNPLDTNTTSICEYLSNPDEIPRAPQLTSFPLTLEGGGLGVLNIARSVQLAPDEVNEIRITLAEIANIIRYAQINDLVQRDTFRSAFMSEITSMMQMNMGLGDTLFMVVNILGKALNCSRCIFVCTDGGAGWKCYEYWQRERGVESSQEYGWPTKDSAVVSRALLSPMPVVIFEGQMGSYLTPAQEEMQFIGVRSLLAVGIRSTLGVHGCMVVQQCDSRRAWTRAEMDMVQSVADTVAEALVQLPEEKRYIEPIMRLHQRDVFDTKDADQQSIQDVRKALKGVLGQTSIPNARKAPARSEHQDAYQQEYEYDQYDDQQYGPEGNEYQQVPEHDNVDYAPMTQGAGALSGLADSIIADQTPAGLEAPAVEAPFDPPAGGKNFPGVLGGILGNTRAGAANAGAWDIQTSHPLPPPPAVTTARDPWQQVEDHPQPTTADLRGAHPVTDDWNAAAPTEGASWNNNTEPSVQSWETAPTNENWSAGTDWNTDAGSAEPEWGDASDWGPEPQAPTEEWGSENAAAATQEPWTQDSPASSQWGAETSTASTGWSQAPVAAQDSQWGSSEDWGGEPEWSSQQESPPPIPGIETPPEPVPQAPMEHLTPPPVAQPALPPPAVIRPASPFTKSQPAKADAGDESDSRSPDPIPTPSVRPPAIGGIPGKGVLPGIARSALGAAKPVSPFATPTPAGESQEPDISPVAESPAGESKWGALDSIGTNPAPGANISAPAPQNKWGDLDSIGTKPAPATPDVEIPTPQSTWGNLDSIGTKPAPAGSDAEAPTPQSKWGDLDSIGTKPAPAKPGAEAPTPQSRWGDLDGIGTQNAQTDQCTSGKWGNLDAIGASKDQTASGSWNKQDQSVSGNWSRQDQSASGSWGDLNSIRTPPNATGKGLGGAMLGKARISSISTPGGGLGSSLMKDRNRGGQFVDGPPLEIDEAAAEAKLKQILSTSNPTSDYIFATPNVDARLLGRIDGWVSQVEQKDKYVNGHARAVAEYSSAIARLLGMTPDEVNKVRLAAIVHDIGKLKLPQSILQKPEDDLTDAELVQTMEHPIVAAKLLNGIPELQELADSVLHHHEEWDGNGYPGRDNNGLPMSGEEIPLLARIIHVADGYHGRISDLTYRAGMPADEAQEEMRAAAGITYDPAIVDALLACIAQGLVAAVI